MFRVVFVVYLTLGAKLVAGVAPLQMGFMPYLSAEVVHERYAPLAAYLSQKLNHPVEIAISRDHNDHMQKTGTNHYCISFLGGNPYVRIVEQYGPKPPLVRFEFDGQPTFRSVIVVAKEAPFASLDELKTRRIAFGDPSSTLSTQVAIYTLQEAGVTLESLAGYTHLGNHENILYGVLYGDFEAGAVAEEIFLEHRQRGLRALAYSPRLSTHLFVARSDMAPQMQAAITQALLQLRDTPGGKEILQNINPILTGFVPAKDSHYDQHRHILDAKVRP